MNWDLYDATGSNNGDLTGYSSTSATTFQTQDGYYSGTLRNISVDEDGIITGAYSNGQLVPLFRLALADFPSYEGLRKMGENLYAESLSSGQALPGTPSSGGLGNIAPSALEMSNVDLASEFVKMITTQRAFQANARVITTSDEILAELINIKR
jgi:flagellar hook protein FlgE